MFLHAELTSCDIAVLPLGGGPHTCTQINAYSQSHANSWVKNVGGNTFPAFGTVLPSTPRH